MIRVTAPSRLHFGLLNIPNSERLACPGLDGQPGLPIRAYGGVGLMVDRPGISVRLEPSKRWEVSGALSNRALAFATAFVSTVLPEQRSPFRIVVESAPSEHTGLGVGTQLAMAIARGIAQYTGLAALSPSKLAMRVGRGQRSALGVHGFGIGGLLLEAGKLPGESISPLVAHVLLPNDWAVVLFSPPGGQAWHGDRERQAFGDLSVDSRQADALYRIVLSGILPAAVSHDLDSFGDAVYEFNARVGDLFAPAQGGRYCS